jgi:hypothetical protein
LNTFTSVWFSDNIFNAGFKFYEGYPLPECRTIEEYNDFINNMPLQDIPEVRGLYFVPFVKLHFSLLRNIPLIILQAAY